MKSPNAFALCLLFLLSLPHPAIGQDPQYISPGSLANETVPTQERVLQAAEEAAASGLPTPPRHVVHAVDRAVHDPRMQHPLPWARRGAA